MTDLHQMTLDEVARARRADPATSKEAARRAHGLAGEHERRILQALSGGESLTAHDIARRTLLTPVQVSRRLGHMRDEGRIVVDPDAIGMTPSDRPCQAWRLP